MRTASLVGLVAAALLLALHCTAPAALVAASSKETPDRSKSIATTGQTKRIREKGGDNIDGSDGPVMKRADSALETREKNPAAGKKPTSDKKKKKKRRDADDRLLKLTDLTWNPTGTSCMLRIPSAYDVQPLPQAPGDDGNGLFHPAKTMPKINAVGDRAAKEPEVFSATAIGAAYKRLYPTDACTAPPAIIVAIDLLLKRARKITNPAIARKLFRNEADGKTMQDALIKELLSNKHPVTLMRLHKKNSADGPLGDDVAVALAWAIHSALNRDDLPPLFRSKLQDKLTKAYGAGATQINTGGFVAPLKGSRAHLHKILVKSRPDHDAHVWNIVDILLRDVSDICEELAANVVDPEITTKEGWAKYFAPMLARGFFRRLYGGKPVKPLKPGEQRVADPEEGHLTLFNNVAATVTQGLILDWPELLIVKPAGQAK